MEIQRFCKCLVWYILGRYPNDRRLSMSNLLVLPDLREMLVENDDVGLAQVVTELHPATIADFSEGLIGRGDVATLGPCAGGPAGRRSVVLSCRRNRSKW